MFFYNTIEDPDWTAVLYAALIMLSVPIIILGFFKVVHKVVSPSPIKQPWSSIFIQFIFGVALFLFGAIKITSHSSNTDTKSSDSEPSNPEPTSAEPSSTVPTTAPIPETPDTSSDIIGYTLMIIAAVFLLGFIIVLIARKVTTAHNTRRKLQHEIQRIRDTNVTQLREIMAAFTAESTNPINTLKYPLYRAAEHPTNRAYVTAMMFAYKEQQALDEAIDKYFKRNPGMIFTQRFEQAVAETAKHWDMLNYQAKKIGSPLLSFTTQRKATNLLERALDESNYAPERDAAMSRLIQLLNDARTQLHSHNSDNAVLIDVILDTITDAQNNGNKLCAPDVLRELTAAADAQTQQDLNLPALTP